MVYGAGRSRLLREQGMEEASERARYERELKVAEDAAKAESEGSSLWSAAGGIGGGLWGLFTGGLQGAYKGFQWGKEGGKWGHRLFSGYDPSDYDVSTDVGKFGVSQKYALEDINKQFEVARDAQFWKDIAGTGASAMSLFKPPTDLAGAEWWDVGGGAPDWLRKIRGSSSKIPGQQAGGYFDVT